MTNSKSGLGVGGSPRKGNPKTDTERRREHQERHPGTPLPPRGSGLKRSR